MQILPNAHYRHYKRGTDYRVLCLGVLEANEEPCVVYQSLADQKIWIRPVSDFLATVEHEGAQVPRFTYLGQLE